MGYKARLVFAMVEAPVDHESALRDWSRTFLAWNDFVESVVLCLVIESMISHARRR